MSTAVAERTELAKLCSSKDWSKAIRVLDSLLSQSCAIQDLCNRAFCYSQLELHKHAIKDCDNALQLDPKFVQAFILKGCALSALGRKEEAILIWEKGYMHAVQESADIKHILELVELLRSAKSNGSVSSEKDTDSPQSVPCLKSNGMSDSYCKSNGKTAPKSSLSEKVDSYVVLHKESSLNVEGEKQYVSQPSESHKSASFVVSEATDDFLKKSLLSDSSESSEDELLDFNDISCESLTLSELQNELLEEVRGSRKLSLSGISKASLLTWISDCQGVNDGKYAYAISIFDKILEQEPDYTEALIGRGTAYAFQRDLHSAIADFSKAIQSNPSAAEAWKRRGQAQAALGESAKAIADLTKAMEFEPKCADILHERGIVNFKFKDFEAAVEDLLACVEIEKDNKSAFTYLGLALFSLGDYKGAEEAHMKAIQIDKNFLDAWTHLAQFYQDMANSERALQCLHEILRIHHRSVKAHHLRGLLLHGMGDHRNAIKDLSNGLAIEGSNIECLYLRASCYHAIGEFKEAVKDYDAALDLELDSMEKFVIQCLAFYQKEIALYTASKFNTEFSWFDLDGDIDPLFKEYWCKKLHPKAVCEKVYRQPPLRDSTRKGKLKKQEFSLTKQKTALLHAVDTIGKKIQYNSPGFLPNKRQHRMAGLAIIEIAQKIVKVWRSLQTEWKNSSKGSQKHGKKARRKEMLNPPSHNRGGAGCSTSRFSETSTSLSAAEDGSYKRLTSPWRTVYSFAIKWRQISEPCDPVFWVNNLSEDSSSGFGPQNPLVLGHSKVVRNSSYHKRVFDVAKEVVMENKYLRDMTDNIIFLQESKLLEIINAGSCSELHKAVGQDFWLTTWCNSMTLEGKRLEGTRICLTKSGETGYDFSIRTPSPPSRWEDFELEMTASWEAICQAVCGENYGTTDFDALENVREAILRMTYYWYNFMPLTRGSAVVGLIVLLGLLLASNMEFTGTIPQGFLLDWEAILEPDPNSFISSIKSWLYPSLKMNTSWKGYPDVASTFETTGLVVAALSSSAD